MTTLSALSPMLRTPALDETIAFYQSLGFACLRREQEWGWAVLGFGPIEIMLAQDEAAPAFTGSLYFRTTDVDALWARYQSLARVCYPIEDFDYGMREFAIYDNNGYLLQFGAER